MIGVLRSPDGKIHLVMNADGDDISMGGVIYRAKWYYPKDEPNTSKVVRYFEPETKD